MNKLSYKSQQLVLKTIDAWLKLPPAQAASAFMTLVFAIDQIVPEIGVENIHIYNIGNIRNKIAEMSVVEDN